MAKKQRPVAKRPPAHEVILARLQELAREIVVLRRRILEDAPCSGLLITTEGGTHACGELLGVLERIHLPEQERPKILETLRGLDTGVIGVHRSHVRLLKELSGHSPAHTMGAKPKRRRA